MPLLLSRDDAISLAVAFHALWQALRTAEGLDVQAGGTDDLLRTLRSIREATSRTERLSMLATVPVLDALARVIQEDTLPPTNCFTCIHERGDAERPDCKRINDDGDDGVTFWWESVLVEVEPGSEVYYVPARATGCPGHRFEERILALLEVEK